MLTIFLVLCLCIGTNANAANDNSTSTSTTTSDSFDEDAELKKIAETCFSDSDFKELAGYTDPRDLGRTLGYLLLPAGVETIGLMEMRTALNLEPLPPWKRPSFANQNIFDRSLPIQTYYDLLEPRSALLVDSEFFNEPMVTNATAYLDKRVPAIRMIFRRRFEDVRRAMELVDRKTVNHMVRLFGTCISKIDPAVDEITSGDNPKCREATN
ncbi:unnamed protein product [Caenorhabditis nigoni]